MYDRRGPGGPRQPDVVGADVVDAVLADPEADVDVEPRAFQRRVVHVEDALRHRRHLVLAVYDRVVQGLPHGERGALPLHLGAEEVGEGVDAFGAGAGRARHHVGVEERARGRLRTCR